METLINNLRKNYQIWDFVRKSGTSFERTLAQLPLFRKPAISCQIAINVT